MKEEKLLSRLTCLTCQVQKVLTQAFSPRNDTGLPNHVHHTVRRHVLAGCHGHVAAI